MIPPWQPKDTAVQSDTTMSTGVLKFVVEIEKITGMVKQIAEQTVSKEMTVKVDQFQKSYGDQNKDLLK